MRFLVDESCDAIIVRALRERGYDVVFVAETMRGASDADVLQTATDEARILITQDRDFCTLVFRDNRPSYGIILVRVPDQLRNEKAQCIIDLVEQEGDRLPDSFVSLRLTSIRIRALPVTLPGENGEQNEGES
jgi:predicted nuclease of predicted toxin-antitoxin system